MADLRQKQAVDSFKASQNLPEKISFVQKIDGERFNIYRNFDIENQYVWQTRIFLWLTLGR